MTERKQKLAVNIKAGKRVAESAPVTRKKARQRRAEPPARTKPKRLLDAFPDRIDVRDWFYQPTLRPLPDSLVNCDGVPKILDQGNEGACTGFALAAVINYHLAQRRIKRFVSPRMLYELARKYDEWPGESYEGSSARGAMMGWIRHGVCLETSWTERMKGSEHFSQKIADEAQNTPGGAFYRIQHREVRHMQAALSELGILYMTLMVHSGWDDPQAVKGNGEPVRLGNGKELELPVIQRKGHASDGHAVAIVGYTRKGFIIQNSWGPGWGAKGFALLPYEDFLMHATDVWAAQLGVPVEADLWQGFGAADVTAGIQRAANAIPLNDIRPYVVDCGNDGVLSNGGEYWTTEADIERLFATYIPEQTKSWSKRRVLLYLHGGLNSEEDVARRVIAFRDVFLANEIYPLHIMWETGAFETLQDMISDFTKGITERAASIADWWNKTREGLVEAKDRTFEVTTACVGRRLWDEMKENANLSSNHPGDKGAMQLLALHAKQALQKSANRDNLELHVIGHSAGSIFAAYALRLLLDAGVKLGTIQFMAPAITVDLFKRLMLPSITQRACPHPVLYLLSNSGELKDSVGPYGKSLLYLVSNAFEEKRSTPLLGMEKYISPDAVDEEGHRVGKPDPEIGPLFHQNVDGFPSLVISGQPQGPRSSSKSTSHGGFDNDPDTLNSMLRRILNSDQPAREFTVRDLQY